MFRNVPSHCGNSRKLESSNGQVVPSLTLNIVADIIFLYVYIYIWRDYLYFYLHVPLRERVDMYICTPNCVNKMKW